MIWSSRAQGRSAETGASDWSLDPVRPLADVLAGMKMVAEGVRTTDTALALGLAHGIELPIAAQMSDVLAGRLQPRAAVEELMLRPQRPELDVP